MRRIKGGDKRGKVKRSEHSVDWKRTRKTYRQKSEEAKKKMQVLHLKAAINKVSDRSIYDRPVAVPRNTNPKED